MPSPKTLLIYCSSFIIVFFCNLAFDLACGPETDPYDYYVSFFHNDIVQPNHNYRSFYYNGAVLLNDENEQVSEADINAHEWAGYLGGKVNMTDVRQVMYRETPKVDSILLLKYLKTGAVLPDSLQKNTFLTAVTSPANKSALQYYVFAKSAEAIANVPADYHWNPIPLDTVKLTKKGLLALRYAQAEKDEFIKLRYYYQAQRLLHYAKQYKQAMAVYDQYLFNSHSKSHVMGWVLALKAGEEKKLGNPALADCLFAKVFAQYPERRVQAYINFTNIKTPLQDVLKLTINDREKAFVYAIKGFNTPGPDISALKQVYQYQPQSDLVSVLLLREINKIEESYMTVGLNRQADNSASRASLKPDTTAIKFEEMIPGLQAFCKQLAAERKYTEPGLGYLGSAYLYWITKQNKAGLDALAAINNEKLSTRLDDEKQIVKLLLLAQKAVKLDSLSEKELLPSLQWINQKSHWEYKAIKAPDRDKYWGDYDLRRVSAAARDFYSEVLAPMYLRQKDTAMAALAILKSDRMLFPKSARYLTSGLNLGYEMPSFWQQNLRSAHLKTILNWQKLRVKKPYLNLMMSNVDNRVIFNIYDLLGTAYLREHNYEAAASTLALVDKQKSNKTPNTNDKEQYLYANPFISPIKDYPKLYTASKAKGFTKLMFATTMAALQKQIKANPKDAAAWYKMATGLYNTSTYGNCSDFISYQWSAYDYESEATNYFDADFLKAINAEKYYLNAREVSNNPEFKARCTFMAAKCRQKQVPYPQNTYDYTHYAKFEAMEKQFHIKYRQNAYFAELNRDYKNTQFFKTAVHECSYLRDFLRGGERIKAKG